MKNTNKKRRFEVTIDDLIHKDLQDQKVSPGDIFFIELTYNTKTKANEQ
ncbi:hypothetical protein [Clostridium culturomicium]